MSICSPPAPGSRSSTVTVPKSVCGPIRNCPGSGGPTSVERRVAVDVERPGRVLRQRRERFGRHAQGVGAEAQQIARHRRHRGQVALRGRAQLRHLRRPHVGREPHRVDGRVAGRRRGPDRERLLEVRRELDRLPALEDVGVPLDSTPGASQPRPPIRTAYRSLTAAGRAKNRRAAARSPVPQTGVHAVPRDQQEPCLLQGLVDAAASGDRRSTVGIMRSAPSGPPRCLRTTAPAARR